MGDKVGDKPHWIEENTRTKSVMFVCSECGKIAHDSPCGFKKNQVVRKPCSLAYCPHCGVKMDGVQESFNQHILNESITCCKCHGKGKYEVPIDPDYSWDECEERRCELCNGTGRLTKEFYEMIQKLARMTRGERDAKKGI